MAVSALGGIDYYKNASSRAVDERLVESVKPQNFSVASTQCAFSIDSVDQCVLGTFQVASLVGEITAWGDATDIVPDSVTLYCNSLKDLYGVDTGCVIRATNPKEVEISFYADGVVVAAAVVTVKSDVRELRLVGTCTWEYVFSPKLGTYSLTSYVDSPIRLSSRKYPRNGRRVQRQYSRKYLRLCRCRVSGQTWRVRVYSIDDVVCGPTFLFNNFLGAKARICIASSPRD